MDKNHKENEECKKKFYCKQTFNESKKSFTKNWVYKSQIIKYILLVKIKELNELEQSLKQRNQ